MNYTLQGNSYSDVYSFIQIVVKRCSGSSKWKSTTAIDNAINGLSLSFTMVNTYFDLEDYSSPVKTYLDDRINIAVTSGYTKTTVIFTQQRTSSKSDSYFSLWDTSTSDDFVGVENYSQDFDLESNNGNVLVAFVIKLDPVQQQYTRSVYNFLQFTGDIGGVFQILEILGGVLVGIFAQKLFK